MPLFAWANGSTPAQVRTQADTDMDLIMGADNWLVVVCPRGTFRAQGSRWLIAARALNAAGWFMARIHEPAAQQMLFSHIVWDPAFLSQLLQSVLATLPTQTVPSLEAALQIWVATVASSADATVIAAREAVVASFFTLAVPNTRQVTAIDALPAEQIWFERARVCDLGLDGDAAVPAAGILCCFAVDRYVVDNRITAGDHSSIIVEIYRFKLTRRWMDRLGWS